METVEICAVCAMGLKERGVELRPAGYKQTKISCAICGRRRYGGKYEKEGKR